MSPYEEKLRFESISEADILHSFENFNEADWRDFLRDLVTNPEKLSVKFNVRTGDDVLIVSSVLLAKLGVLPRKHLSKALDILVVESLRQINIPRNENYIKSYFHIAKTLGEGIRTDLLSKIIVNNNVQKVIRKDAAAVLANYRVPVAVNFWDSFDFNEYYFLTPAAVSSLGKHYPIKAIEILARIDNFTNIEEIFSQLKYPIKKTIIYLEKIFESSFASQINEILDNSHPRIKEYIENLPEFQTISNSIFASKVSKKQETIFRLIPPTESKYKKFVDNVKKNKKLPYYKTQYQTVNIFHSKGVSHPNDVEWSYLNAVRDEVKSSLGDENITIQISRRKISGIDKLVQDILSGEVIIPEIAYATKVRGRESSIVRVGKLDKGSILVPDYIINEFDIALDIKNNKTDKIPKLSDVLDFCISEGIQWISQPISAISQVLDDLFAMKMNEFDSANTNDYYVGGIENPDDISEILFPSHGRKKPRKIAVLDYLTAVYIKRKRKSKKVVQRQVKYDNPLPVGFFFPKNDNDFSLCVWNAVNKSFFDEKRDDWNPIFKSQMTESLIVLDREPSIETFNMEKGVWESEEKSNDISRDLKIKQVS